MSTRASVCLTFKGFAGADVVGRGLLSHSFCLVSNFLSASFSARHHSSSSTPKIVGIVPLRRLYPLSEGLSNLCPVLCLWWGKGIAVQRFCSRRSQPQVRPTHHRREFVYAVCRMEWASSFWACRYARSPIGSCSYQDDAVSATLNFAHEESHDAAHEMSQAVQGVNPTELGNVGRTAASNLSPASCRKRGKTLAKPEIWKVTACVFT